MYVLTISFIGVVDAAGRALSLATVSFNFLVSVNVLRSFLDILGAGDLVIP